MSHADSTVTVLSLLKVWASAANVRGLDYLQLGMVADQLERAGMPQSPDGLWCVPTAAELPALLDRQQPPTAPTPEAVRWSPGRRWPPPCRRPPSPPTTAGLHPFCIPTLYDRELMLPTQLTPRGLGPTGSGIQFASFSFPPHPLHTCRYSWGSSAFPTLVDSTA